MSDVGADVLAKWRVVPEDVLTFLLNGGLYQRIYIYIYVKRKKGRNYIFPTSLFRESLHSSGVYD